MNNQHLKIIYTALDNLKTSAYIGKTVRYEVVEGTPIELKLYIKETEQKFVVNAKSELRLSQVSNLLSHASTNPQLIIAEKIGREAKEALVANEISYIEVSGNIYLSSENMMILLDTKNKLKNTISKKSRAFTKTGLRVVFHFLMNEAFLKMSYRQIAAETGVSLGNITNIINALIELEYLDRTTEDILYMKNKEHLFKRWVDAYDHTLKPDIEVGRFSFKMEDDFLNWRKTRLEDKKTVWGGAPGTFLLLGRPSPSELTIYTDESRADIISNYRLEPDPEGSVYVYRKFWTYSDHKINIAPTLLLYTDLINSTLEKNHKAAEILYDDVLKGRLSDKHD